MCDGLPLSGACLALRAATGAATTAASSVLDSVGGQFAAAAEAVLDAVFEAITTTATVDLTASYVTTNAAALGSVALVLVVGLFVFQVLTAAVRREPGGLARAVTGAAFAILGTAAAATIVQSLLVVVDGLCDGIASLAGTSIQDAARRLLNAAVLSRLTEIGGGGAALMIVFGLLFIVGAVLTLGTLLVRQALIVVAVVVAPLALAGGAARITSGWVKRWAQVTLALILSKLAIVIVFVVAVGMLGTSDGIGALLSGLILLLVAALAPWACFKVLDFAGTHIANEWHRATNGSTLAVAHQGQYTAATLMRSVAPIVGGGAGAAAAGAGAAGARAGAAGGAAGGGRPGGGWPTTTPPTPGTSPGPGRGPGSGPTVSPAPPAGSPAPSSGASGPPAPSSPPASPPGPGSPPGAPPGPAAPGSAGPSPAPPAASSSSPAFPSPHGGTP